LFGVRELERLGVRRDVGAFGEQGLPVLLQFFHCHGSFRRLLPQCLAHEARRDSAVRPLSISCDDSVGPEIPRD
jgi:hypothetical protein